MFQASYRARKLLTDIKIMTGQKLSFCDRHPVLEQWVVLVGSFLFILFVLLLLYVFFNGRKK